VLERGIHKVIRFKGIPVNAVIKVRDGKVLLVGENRRTASVYRSEGFEGRGAASKRERTQRYETSAGDAVVGVDAAAINLKRGINVSTR
jgi:hypothetical protein